MSEGKAGFVSVRQRSEAGFTLGMRHTVLDWVIRGKEGWECQLRWMDSINTVLKLCE